ncbi:NADP-dependent oxidoreductase [Rhodococcus triatomae]|nr:NADP-dependent oxidoreductase [Rhodococcus triatomae BKS 15-14]
MVTTLHTQTNTTVRLARRPSGMPEDNDWSIADEPVERPDPGEVLVETLYVSVDPAMRAWVSGAQTYRAPVNPGDIMPAAAAGRVIESRDAALEVGDLVTGDLGVQRYAVRPARVLERITAPVDALPEHLGVLGIAGITAYIGLHDIGRLKPGDTLVVSGAAGAVGSAAGQIARAFGARVIGIAGGEEKCRYVVDDLGFDACLDHRDPELASALSAAAPKGIDVYFDNVGGDVLEAALDNLARGARIILCGAVSQYNSERMAGPSNYMELLIKRASMTGFVVFDHRDRFDQARAELSALLSRGELRADLHIRQGLHQFPTALRDLFTGTNRGKVLLKTTTNNADRAENGATR